jgi:hypothetical protein
MHVIFDLHEGDEQAMHNASSAVLSALDDVPGCKVVDAMYGDNNPCWCEGEPEGRESEVSV